MSGYLRTITLGVDMSEIIDISGGKFLRLNQVIDRTGLGRDSIYRMAKKGTFPKPRRLSARASGWLESEVSDWVKSRVLCRDEPILTPDHPRTVRLASIKSWENGHMVSDVEQLVAAIDNLYETAGKVVARLRASAASSTN